MQDALKLLDLTNIPSKSYTTYNLDSLRNYLKNPLSDSNSKNLRKLSQYLYVLSAHYRRIIAYFSSQIDTTAYNVIPNISMTEDNDDEKILQNYEQALKWVEKMNLPGQIFSILTTAWREDCVYLYAYYDEDGEQDVNSFILLPMDPEYCKISSINYDGTINYAFDFSYFDNSTNSVYLEYWDTSFQTMYNTYQNDRNQKWQELDPERAWCFKVNADQLDRVIPPFASLFQDIIMLEDLKGIANVEDELSIYKLLVAKIDTLSNTQEVDDFQISLDLATQFIDKINGVLPDEIGLVLSPMTIEPITFDKNVTTEKSNSISKSSSNLFESAGVSQVLDSSKITGSTAVKLKQIFDGVQGTKPLLQQIEARVNRFLDFIVPDNGMRVKYMPDVTPYSKADKITQLKDAAALGLPVKTAYLTLLGVSPLDGHALSYMENNILKLQDKWQYPLQSSYTQAGGTEGKESGGQEKPIEDLGDEGESSRDLEKSKM